MLRLAAYQFYSDNFLVPLKVLLQAEVLAWAETMMDDPFGTLEWIEVERLTADSLETVELAFSVETFAVFTRLAQLLRMTVEEFVGGMLCIGGDMMTIAIKTAKMDGGIDECDDLPAHAAAAIKFHLQETLGGGAKGTMKGAESLRDFFNLGCHGVIEKPAKATTKGKGGRRADAK